MVNANPLLNYILAYNLFNWFRRLALIVSMRKQRIDTIRLKLLKIAERVVKSVRYKYFKLCSSCPTRKNSARHWKISVTCIHNWNSNY
uniref:transposase n=1 Tax=Parablautia intestinalis TaxID=2320100 RepID=UPI0038CD8604